MGSINELADEVRTNRVLLALDAAIQEQEEKVRRLGYPETRAYLQGLVAAKEIVEKQL